MKKTSKLLLIALFKLNIFSMRINPNLEFRDHPLIVAINNYHKNQSEDNKNKVRELLDIYDPYQNLIKTQLCSQKGVKFEYMSAYNYALKLKLFEIAMIINVRKKDDAVHEFDE